MNEGTIGGQAIQRAFEGYVPQSAASMLAPARKWLKSTRVARSSTRSNDWGFPRWRSYGASREAKPVRICDRHGCDEPGNCPAPKSPNSPDRWYFCETHAAEYNRGWDYFQGLSAEEAAAREASERQTSAGYAQ